MAEDGKYVPNPRVAYGVFEGPTRFGKSVPGDAQVKDPNGTGPCEEGEIRTGRLHAKGYTLAHHLLSGSPGCSANGGARHARPRAAGRHSPKRGVLRVLRRLGGPCERGGVMVS